MILMEVEGPWWFIIHSVSEYGIILGKDVFLII